LCIHLNMASTQIIKAPNYGAFMSYATASADLLCGRSLERLRRHVVRRSIAPEASVAGDLVASRVRCAVAGRRIVQVASRNVVHIRDVAQRHTSCRQRLLASCRFIRSVCAAARASRICDRRQTVRTSIRCRVRGRLTQRGRELCARQRRVRLCIVHPDRREVRVRRTSSTSADAVCFGQTNVAADVCIRPAVCRCRTSALTARCVEGQRRTLRRDRTGQADRRRIRVACRCSRGRREAGRLEARRAAERCTDTDRLRLARRARCHADIGSAGRICILRECTARNHCRQSQGGDKGNLLHCCFSKMF
jgi:hypothetical protein